MTLYTQSSIYIHYYADGLSAIATYCGGDDQHQIVTNRINQYYLSNKFKKHLFKQIKPEGWSDDSAGMQLLYDTLDTCKTGVEQAINTEFKLSNLPNSLAAFKGAKSDIEFTNLGHAQTEFKSNEIEIEQAIKILQDIITRFQNVLEVLTNDTGIIESIKTSFLETMLNNSSNMQQLEQVFQSHTLNKQSTGILSDIQKLIPTLTAATDSNVYNIVELNDEAKQVHNQKQSILNTLATTLKFFQKQCDNNSQFIQDNKNMIAAFIGSLSQQINQISGWATEDLVVLNTYKLYEPIESLLNDNNYTYKITASRTGSDRVNRKINNSVLQRANIVDQVTSTKDVHFEIQPQGNAYGGNLTLNIPVGSSLKFSGALQAGLKKGKITVKSNEVILANILHDLDNQTLFIIYNVLANYGRTRMYKNAIEASQHRRKYTKNPIQLAHYHDILNAFRTVATINGLMGQLTKEDSSYYIIINGQVFTIFDFINALIGRSGLTIGDNKYNVSSGISDNWRLEPSQARIRDGHNTYEIAENGETPLEAAHRRSSRVIGEILHARLRGGIKLLFTKI